jgi:hypothetical protein
MGNHRRVRRSDTPGGLGDRVVRHRQQQQVAALRRGSQVRVVVDEWKDVPTGLREGGVQRRSCTAGANDPQGGQLLTSV